MSVYGATAAYAPPPPWEGGTPALQRATSLSDVERGGERDDGNFDGDRDRLTRMSRTPLLGGGQEAGGKEGELGGKSGSFASHLVTAIINVVISVPGLYGYTAVIFHHDVYSPYMNALPKLVILSSAIHQLGFTIFSSLPFAIGTVQDAGLIFLAAMSTLLADEILGGGGTAEEVVSTALVILPLGTAALGLVLVAMGRYGLADAVAYLPMPVVGGYLAFIGYFCVEAGVGLSISSDILRPADWAQLTDGQNLLLAVPGLAAGWVLTYLSRHPRSENLLPLAMIGMPALFYAAVFLGFGGGGVGSFGLAEVREGGWVGPTMDPVPAGDLLRLINLDLVRWDLIPLCFETWVGMVFVVAFASCLDVAAIGMDMGEALDANRELATVGICNVMSGCTVGFTGSYIFSQTIFTYRTGCRSRWVGILIMIVFVAVVAAPVNFLSVLPLFFVGATLTFIGYDLLYEWLWEVRQKLLLSEYLVLIATFGAIHIVGIDAGILFGVVIAGVDYVLTTAREESTVTRVTRRSRAVWKPDDWKLLQTHGYGGGDPRIVTFEVRGSVFFGSSVQLLRQITGGLGLSATDEETKEAVLRSPGPHRGRALLTSSDRSLSFGRAPSPDRPHRPPQYVVLDLSLLTNLDASAARGSFVQLAKMCGKRGIVVCATGANPRVEWMMRSHEVSYGEEEEEEAVKASLLKGSSGTRSEKVLLFLTIFEGLEFCENLLVKKMAQSQLLPTKRPSFIRLDELISSTEEGVKEGQEKSLSRIFAHILDLPDDRRSKLTCLDLPTYREEVTQGGGDVVFRRDTNSDSFFVVLGGEVALLREEARPAAKKGGSQPPHARKNFLSGAGQVSPGTASVLARAMDQSGEVRVLLQAGALFGYVDFLLERPRMHGAVATKDGTVLAKFTHRGLEDLKATQPEAHGVIESVLLQSSIQELANCTCTVYRT